MKNYLLFLLLITVSSTGFAQFGLNAGYLSSTTKLSGDGGSITSDAISGFNIGLTYTLDLNETLMMRPELHFVSVSDEGESANGLLIPVPVMYALSDAFSLQIGPAFGFSLEESVDDFSNFALSAVVGASYMLTDNVYGQLRYFPQLSNSYTGEGDLKVRNNTFSVSVGYNF